MTQIIDLGKLRFNFLGEWDGGSTTYYEYNDVVKYGGNVYVYTSPIRTTGKIPTNSDYWVLMVPGFNMSGAWNSTISYQVGDAVSYGSKVFVCIVDSPSGKDPEGIDGTTYWSQFADGIQWEGEFNPAVSYQINDVIKYGGSLYIATKKVIANSNTLPTDTTYFNVFINGISPQGVYSSTTTYKPGELVAYGANIYQATNTTTNNLPTDTTNWNVFLTGTSFKGIWNNATNYGINELISYGANLYRAKSYVSAGTLPTNITYWEVTINGFSAPTVWDNTVTYVTNQVVTYSGSLYQAIQDNTSKNPRTETSYWLKIASGINNAGDWGASTLYYVDDIVKRGGSTYKCTTNHTSSSIFSADSSKWTKYNGGIAWKGAWSASTSYLVDDVFSSGNSVYITTKDHTSSNIIADATAGNIQTLISSPTTIPSFTPNKSEFLTNDGTNLTWSSGLFFPYINLTL